MNYRDIAMLMAIVGLLPQSLWRLFTGCHVGCDEDCRSRHGHVRSGQEGVVVACAWILVCWGLGCLLGWLGGTP